MQSRPDEPRQGEQAMNVKRYIPEAEWSGPVYVDRRWWGSDGFFADAGELREWMGDHGEPVPDAVYPCSVEALTMHAGMIIDSATADFCEAVQEQASEAEGELQAALDAWIAKYVTARDWWPIWNERIIMQGAEVLV
jgi:hypothetical protein